MIKRIGFLTVEMALPVLIHDHREITVKDLYDLVKHKVTKDEFKEAIKWGEGVSMIITTFRRIEGTEGNDGKDYERLLQARNTHDLYENYISTVIEALAEGTLNAPVETEVTFTIKTKDIHVDRLKRTINGLKYAEVVEE